ncbi:MAG: helix-turn-helix domain-containing protein [Faecousia sp.]
MRSEEAALCEKRPRWRIFSQFSENNFPMCHNQDGIVRYAPLCVHTFRLISPRKLLEAWLFNQQYHCYEEIQSVPDRLRWCRHHMSLMQKEVAERTGISRARYIDLGTGAVDHYPKEIVDRLAELFGVPATVFLGEYNLFLYRGQGKMIREYRESLGLQKNPFARLIGVDPNLLRAWEADQKQMFRNSWEKNFKDLIKV